jgi:hypothetical protein
VYGALSADTLRYLAGVGALIGFDECKGYEGTVCAQRVRDTVGVHVSEGRRRDMVRAGIALALFGPPSAGTSSDRPNYLRMCARPLVRRARG